LTNQLRGSDVIRRGESEIIIVDNNSPHHKLVKKLQNLPEVTLRRFGRNQGFARAVNEGIAQCRGDWFLLLNPDMTASTTLLDRVTNVAREYGQTRPDAGVIGLQLKHQDGSQQPSCGVFPTLFNTLSGLFFPRWRRKCRPQPGTHRRRVSWVTGCGLLVKRECIEQLQGFDEEFFLYYEDVDFCRRARQHGWTIWYEPNVDVKHFAPLHTREVPPALRLITRHALLTYARKHWPGWQAACLRWIVYLEAVFRGINAKYSSDRIGVEFAHQLSDMVSDLSAGERLKAYQRLRVAAMTLDQYSAEQDQPEKTDHDLPIRFEPCNR
jgi:GT2 family glycosyltransferase